MQIAESSRLARLGLGEQCPVSPAGAELPEPVAAVSNLPAGLLRVALRKSCNGDVFLHCSSHRRVSGDGCAKGAVREVAIFPCCKKMGGNEA